MAWTGSEAAAALRSSPDKTNYAKLMRLIVDGGRLALKQVFDGFHPPANLRVSLNTNFTTLQSLQRTRKLNGHQWALLFPPGGAMPNSNNFDITLLFLLLRSICGLCHPASGWDKKPPAGDTSCEANLARIKWFRNELAHKSTTGINKTTFETIWIELSDTLVHLGMDGSEIDRLRVASIDEGQYTDLLSKWKCEEEDMKQMLDVFIQKQCQILDKLEIITTAAVPAKPGPIPVLPQFYNGISGDGSQLLQQSEMSYDLMIGFPALCKKRQDPPIERVLEVTLEELYFGATRKLKIGRQKMAANGSFYREEKTVEIEIKPGWKACTKIKYSQLGDEKPGVLAADIIFIIQDKPHMHFKRDSCNNLLYTARVSLGQSVAIDINIPLIEGGYLHVQDNQAIQQGMQRRIPGKGMPNHKCPGQRADLIVEFYIELPSFLTAEQRQFLDTSPWLYA